MLSDLYYGDAAAVDAAETFFRDNIQDATKVDKRGNIIVVTFNVVTSVSFAVKAPATVSSSFAVMAPVTVNPFNALRATLA